METKKLTLDELKEMKPGQIIKKGEGVYPELWQKGDLRWVAVRGGIEDWAIYYHSTNHGYDYITDFGDKIYDEKIIRKLVPCTDEAWGMYRF